MRREHEIALWIFALIAASLTARESTASATPPVVVDRVDKVPEPALLRSASRDSLLSSLGDEIVERNMFRLSRSPAFEAAGAAELPAESTVAAPVRPPLALAGIVVGGTPEALLEGLPGREGSVLVRAGDRFDSIRIRRITSDSIFITGADTTWRLGLRRTWQ